MIQCIEDFDLFKVRFRQVSLYNCQIPLTVILKTTTQVKEIKKILCKLILQYQIKTQVNQNHTYSLTIRN